MKLTELAVKKLRAKPKRFEVLDGKGLYLRIAETGTKSWVFRYMQGGRARRYTIGQYPDIGLSDARKIHAELRAAVKAGKDPAGARASKASTFADLFAEFWEKELGKTKSGRQRRLQIEKDALPVWGHRLVADISRRDAVLLLDKVRARAPITANRLQSDLVRMMAFAAERGIIEFSQLGGMKKTPEKPRTRYLSDEEIRLFWIATDGNNIVDLCLRGILLAGQRPGEVRQMAVEELDLEGKTWTIPGEKRKTGDSNEVPTIDLFIELVEQARFLSGDSPFVFRSALSAEKPIPKQRLSERTKELSEELKIEAFTAHDLRRTVRTKLAELGTQSHIAERVLGHKVNGIEAVYNHYGYMDEKRAALETWGAKLQSIIKERNG